MVSLYFLHYDFCRIHNTLRVTSTMEIGLSDAMRDCEWVVSFIDA